MTSGLHESDAGNEIFTWDDPDAEIWASEAAAAAPLGGAIAVPGDLRKLDPIRHRFAFHPPTSDLVASTHNFIRARHLSLARDFMRDLPDCRERSLALTALEESMMWANAAVARVLNYEVTAGE